MRARAFPCAVFLALAAMIPIVAARASFVEEVLIERLRDDGARRDVLRVSERAGDVYGGDVTGVGI